MAQKGSVNSQNFITTVVLLKNLPSLSKNTSQQAKQGELIRFGQRHDLKDIETIPHTYDKCDNHPSGALYKLNQDFSPNATQPQVSVLYRLTQAKISLEIDPSLKGVLSDLEQEYDYLTITWQEDSVIQVEGPIDTITNFLDSLCEQGGAALIRSGQGSVGVPVPDQSSLHSASTATESTSQSTKQSVYENMSPDALALLKKLPIGAIDGIHYDPSGGRILIDKEKEDDRISQFQEAYQSIIGKKLKIIEVPIPSGAPASAVADVVHQYNMTYDQCVFIKQEKAIKIVSTSSRQIDQAKVLLSEDTLKTTTTGNQDSKCEVIHLSSDRTLTLKKADLVKEDVDIIVNPANRRLAHGGGVAAALNQASNGQLQKYSSHHIQQKGIVPVGGIAITAGGGALKCKKVIHAVGPERAYHGEADCERLLNSVVHETLKGAERHNATSISFPAISTGIFGVKKELVARCVVDTITAFHFTKPSPVLSDIRIVIIDEKTYTPFAQYFQQKLKYSIGKKEHRPLIQAAKFNPPQSAAAKKPLQSHESDQKKMNSIEHSSPIQSPTPTTKTSEKKLSLEDVTKIHPLLIGLAEKWQELGFALGFEKDALEQLSATPADCGIHLQRLLNKWLSGDAVSPTVLGLVNALNWIEGTDGIIQSILTAYGNASDPKSPSVTEKDPLSSISYDLDNLPDNNTVTESVALTSVSTTTTMTVSHLTDHMSQVSMGGLTQTSTAGSATGFHSQVTTVQSTHSGSQPGVTRAVAAVPTPSTVVVYGSPPATVPTPPPGMPASSRPIMHSMLSGHNSGQMWRYPTQGEQVQFPFNPTAGQMQMPGARFPSHMQTNNHHPVAPPIMAQGDLLGTMNSNYGGSGQPPYNAPGDNPHNAGSMYSSSDGDPFGTMNRGSGQPSYNAPGGNPHSSIYSGSDGGGGTGSTKSFSQAVAGAGRGAVRQSHYQPSKTSSQCYDRARDKTQEVKDQSKESADECPICLSGFDNPEKTKCGHFFCKDCLYQALQVSPYCPTCKTPLRSIVGNQPVGGRMTVRHYRHALPGYKHCGTIEVNYDIPSGVQTAEHPNPGKRYQGAIRTAYLPDNDEGREVLGLLKRAFDARLIFTVGTSVTSGQKNVVTWNDIHHKTNTTGSPENYGYPDPTYLQRVKADLAAKGITNSDESSV